jgi:hypothetical protein
VKISPSLIDAVGIRVPSRNFTDIPLFAAGSYRSCHFARRASAEIPCDVDIFNKHVVNA